MLTHRRRRGGLRRTHGGACTGTGPSKAEAEYTALAFSIAVAASWWAARVGRARLTVPRMPAIETVGRREHWLEFDGRALREWAMAPIAVSLGLKPPPLASGATVPRRVVILEVLYEDGTLPEDVVYVGRGHRVPTSDWRCPWVPGHDCSWDEWIPRFVQYVHQSGLNERLPELMGKRLACDCSFEEVCKADILAGLVFEECVQQSAAQPARRKNRRVPRRGVLLAWGGLPGVDARAVPWRRWTQEAVVNCFLGLFPEPWFTGFRFPMIEDLISQSPFIDSAEWRNGQHLDWDGPLGPATAPAGVRIRLRTAEGQQAGALSHKAALPPLISGVPNPDDHFAAALAMKMTPTPLEQEAVMDEDLQFLASVMAARRGDLRLEPSGPSRS